MLLLFSHELTEEQKEDAKRSLHVDGFVRLPDELQGLWQNIPPEKPSLLALLAPIRRWVKASAKRGDFVLIQGDFGATYIMVNYCFSLGLNPVYATTERKVTERLLADDTVKTERIFKHRIFRRYEKEGYDE